MNNELGLAIDNTTNLQGLVHNNTMQNAHTMMSLYNKGKLGTGL